MRLDSLVALKTGISRSKAREIIEASAVTVNGKIITKAAKEVSEDDDVAVNALPKYVSRGGLKLEAALDAFQIDVSDLVCLDIGSSTGGFTDCLLRRGAKKVYAVDVGTDQLAGSLKADPRVVSMEKTDIRDLSPEALTEKPELAVCDVSFISLSLILPHAARLADKGVFLIKPQFELTKKALNKSGVVKSEKDREKAVFKVKAEAEKAGFIIKNLAPSPVKGGEGNVEYLIFLEKRKD